MNYSFLIVEDDVLISEHLKRIVLEHGHNVTAICSNEKSTYLEVEKCRPDFAFLDIKLLGNDLGINIGRHLKTLNVPFIFITSYSDKKTIQEAVDLEPKGYILKPFESKEISTAINKLVEFGKQNITIKSAGVKYILNVNDVLYLKSENVYLEIYTSEKKYLAREKMSKFLSHISARNLIQVHRSYAINPSKINKLLRTSIFIEGVEIPVSRNYRKTVGNLNL